MEYIAITIIILIISIAISIKLKKKIECVIPISVVSIILLVYLFGLFDNLKLGVIALYIATILISGYIIYKIKKSIAKKETKQIVKNIVTPGLIVYIALIILSVFINKGRILELYDSFNHWALIVKNMFLYNGYGTVAESIISYNEYPPFTATFQYILLNIKNVYSEDTIIIAQNILYFSLIMPIFSKIEWKKNIKNLFMLLSVVIIIPLVFYKDFYTEIIVDGLLGVIFALGLYQIYKNDSSKMYKYCILTTYMIALSFIKNTGQVFTVILIISEIISILMEKTKEKKIDKKQILGIIISIILVVIAISTWYLKLEISQTEKHWENVQTEDTIYYKQDILSDFIKALYNHSHEITTQDISTLMLVVIYITYSIFLYQKLKNKTNDKNKMLIVLITMIITIFGYIMGMLYVYMNLFTLEEVRGLTSFERYISTIILSAYFLNTLILCNEIEWKGYYLTAIITIILLFMPLLEIKEIYINKQKYISKIEGKIDTYSKILNYKEQLDKDSIVFLMAENIQHNYINAVSKYEMMPIKIEGIRDIQPTLFEEAILQRYTHIFVARIDAETQEKIENILGYKIELKENTLYKVERQNEKIMLTIQK